MATKQREPGIFIWTKSERAGQVVTEDIEKADRQWLYFTDGSRINKSLINEYTLRASTLDEAKRLAEPLGLTTMERGSNPNKVETKTEVKVETNGYYADMHDDLIEKYHGEKITVDKIGGLECGKCHY